MDTVKQDIEFDAKEKENISKLRRQLFGFTNTMTPDDNPAIQTAFRYWRPEDSSREILEAKEFWTPEDMDKADHRFTGFFDEYGQFRGKVRIYDQEPVDFACHGKDQKESRLLAGRLVISAIFRAFSGNPDFLLMNGPLCIGSWYG